MQIAVDATCWQNSRGYGRHARALLTTLVRQDEQNRYTLITDSESAASDLPAQAAVQLVPASVPTSQAASANGRRSVRDMWRMSRALSNPSFDLVFFPTVYSYVPLFTAAKKVVAIHDTIVEAYPELTMPNTKTRLLWRAKVGLACRQADAIVTVSEYSRTEILERFRLDPARVFVAGEASDPVFRVLDEAGLEAHGSLRGRTIVYVGGFSPHKNLEMLVNVFAEIALEEALSDVRLVMVGERESEVFHSYLGAIERRVEVHGISGRVTFTGRMPDEELVSLLNRATVLVLPSLMEGFGLPAVEAAACGCPVIATTASPLPDLLKGAGIFIDPNKPDELRRALTSILKSAELRGRMREAGLKAAERLSWGDAARQLAGVFDAVAAV